MYKALYRDVKSFENGEEYTMLNLPLLLGYLSTSDDVILPNTYGSGKCFDDLKICVQAGRKGMACSHTMIALVVRLKPGAISECQSEMMYLTS